MQPEEQERADLRLVLPAVAAWLVAWQVRLLPPRLVLAGSVVLLVAAAVLVLRHRTARSSAGGAPLRPSWQLIAAATLLCAAAAGLSTAARVQVRETGPVPGLAARGAAVVVTGTVVDDPRLTQPQPGRQPLVVARLRVDVLEAGGRSTALRVPLLVLSTDLSWLPLLPSQRVRAEGRLRAAEPGDDVAAVLSGRGAPVVLSPPSRLQRVAGHLRAGLREAVEPLPEAEQGLLPGLVVGDTSKLPADLREDFRTVGLTHLTAVSGTNVAIVLAAALALSGRLGVRLRVRPVLAGLLLVAFVVLARPSPSVLRAAAMGTVGLLALWTGGRRRAVPALAAAVLVLVLASPDLAASPGFALSVLATAGLLVLAPPWRDALARRLPGWLADALAVPAAAQAACGPVVVALAGTLGLLSVPANLLAVPAVAPATVLGVAAALLAPVWLPLAQVAAWLAYLPTAWLVALARLGADLPLAALPWPDGQGGALLLAALTGLAIPALSRPRLRRALLTALLGTAVAVAGLRVVAPAWPPDGWFLVMCDVGQGDALVVRTGQHDALVVDVGPDPDLVDGCLRRLGVRRVPVVLLTHPHADHVDGLPGVLRGRSVGSVEIGPSDEPEGQARQVVVQAREAGVPVVRAALGQVREAGVARWSVLGPGRTYRGTRSDPNNDSVVVRLEVEGTSVLLSGDTEPEAQADLLASGVDLRADVLKVPHHGSAYQDPGFLAAVGPRVALTSVGADNTYGHPSARTLDLLTRQGARSYRTDQDGDVALVHRGERLRVVGSRGAGTTARGDDGSAPPRPPGVLATPRRARGP